MSEMQMLTKNQISLIVKKMKQDKLLPTKYHFIDQESLVSNTNPDKIFKLSDELTQYQEINENPTNLDLSSDLTNEIFLILNIADKLMTTNVNILIDKAFELSLADFLDFRYLNITKNDLDDIFDLGKYSYMILGDYLTNQSKDSLENMKCSIENDYHEPIDINIKEFQNNSLLFQIILDYHDQYLDKKKLITSMKNDYQKFNSRYSHKNNDLGIIILSK